MIAAVPVAAVTLGVSAWPARVVVAAPGHTTIHVSNPGTDAVVVDAAASGYALDVFGRPRMVSHGDWLSIRPVRFRLLGGRSGELHVDVARPQGARPGDHASLVVLTTEPPGGRRVVARLRLGVIVVARVPGRLVRRLVVEALHVRRRPHSTLVDVAVANLGNVDEWIAAHRLSLRLRSHGRSVATLWAVPRRLLAQSRGLVRLVCRRRIRGSVAAVVELARPRDGVAVLRRTLRLRL